MAQNQMYNPTQAALYGPDLLARQLRLQQSQQFGQQMLEQGQQAPQGQMVSGHYVAPSITQYLSQGLKSYAGRKAMDDLPDQMAGIAQAQQEGTNRMFGIGQPSPQALATGLGGQSQGTPMQSPAGQSQMPLLPGRSAQESAKLFALMGPQEYMKQVATQGAPTDIQKNLIAQGIQPGSPQWNQALGGVTEKAGYIAPVSAAPGATLIDPKTGRPTYSAPQNGVQMQYGSDGTPTASAVPGFAQAQAGIAGAETAATEGAKAGLDLVSVPDGQGGSIQMPRSQAVASLGQNGAPGGAQTSSGAMGHTPSKQTLDARESLPKVTGQTEKMINSIDGILNHPALSNSVGLKSYLPAIRGQARVDFEERSKQLQGQAFLQAFNDLKGGGQITEVEGAKATAAMGRLSTSQGEKAYRGALTELRGILEAAKSRAYQQAGVPMPNGAQGQSAQANSGPPQPRNAQEYQALPSGSVFVAPDGSTRRKP